MRKKSRIFGRPLTIIAARRGGVGRWRAGAGQRERWAGGEGGEAGRKRLMTVRRQAEFSEEEWSGGGSPAGSGRVDSGERKGARRISSGGHGCRGVGVGVWAHSIKLFLLFRVGMSPLVFKLFWFLSGCRSTRKAAFLKNEWVHSLCKFCIYCKF